MQIEVSARHLELNDTIEAYARKKLGKLPRYFDRVQRIAMVMEKTKHGFRTETIVDVEHHAPFVSHNEHEDLYASIDLVTDRASRQLTDHKSRLRDDKS